jgi:hypothetical protein
MNSKFLKSLGLAFAVMMVSAGSAMADTVMFVGTTTGGPTWNRPLAGAPPTGLSAVGTAVPFTVIQLTVGAGGSYVFQNTATTIGYDNFTLLYQNAFNSAAPLINALVANDDNPTIGLTGFTVNMTAGTTYFYVVTGFNNADFGNWSAVITGPGIITVGGGPQPVPEPATMLLLASGLAGLGARLQKKRAQK